MSMLDQNLQDLHKQLVNKQIKAEELVNASFQRIAETDEEIGAFITLDEEKAVKRAREIDERSASELENILLAGIPVGIKDNIVTEGLRTTGASCMLESFIPVYNATVVEKLIEAGAIVVGKCNLNEFGIGTVDEKSPFGVTKNPVNKNVVVGGPSGGAAAAVAAGQVSFALASDTGGSLRRAAANCGVVGLRPTYGLVSRYGLVSTASSMDTIGPITRTVSDAAYVLQAIAGYDTRDSRSVEQQIPNYVEEQAQSLQGLKIGIPKEYFSDELNADGKELIQNQVKELEKLGATCEEVSLPLTDVATAVYILIATAEAASGLSRYDGIRYGKRSEQVRDLLDVYVQSRTEGFGSAVKQAIVFGTYFLSAGNYERFVVKADQVRTLIRQQFADVFEKYDVLLTPTIPTTETEELENDFLSAYQYERYTIPASLAGLPAISIPCGEIAGMPFGLQLVGKAFDEKLLLRVAYALEQTRDRSEGR